ncbi:MAG: 4'-phosphopantetheinyl transferase superfamily protein [Oscillospiraceae bacterium]|nr:4'-phosphopantetheinyl transferase superfamily protein [Clostridia bacterium]MBQ9857936.1 4'-phosphopantetheinyl transferase superfamily protein [Oscillospiraceae bacterium]
MIKLYRYDIAELPHSAAEASNVRHEAGLRLIKQAAAELCGVKEPVILRTEAGKPYFKDIPLKFSVSHSGRCVILAVSDREIGADVQYMAERSLDIAKRYFTDKEREYVGGDIIRFYEIWTKKEAYAKWDGRGFALARSIDVTNLVFYTENDGQYALAVYEK